MSADVDNSDDVGQIVDSKLSFWKESIAAIAWEKNESSNIVAIGY